ncbi:hypothetical protein DSO57_1018437 [Entomophthora muscae]|uniref:Uncharacterized protein n=1 Tax=Entomophthora muscae TaxID=34485 RepID=A0ACC2UDU6_9FUNG|nr:hypothetical protein DSO57_1018437 [Entomophthora muscae]
MKFNIFVPENPKSLKLPGLVFLSGLTCTEDNFFQKACAIERASELGLFLICPDTSPRGCKIEGEDDSYDIGTGAGFFVDATEPKWSKNYRMYTYISEELLELVITNFSIDSNLISISGHSMGGHGALTISLRNPDKFKSCSAFAPICNPMQCAWGQKAFTTYLGSDKSTWEKYDASELIKKMDGISAFPILISQGSKDEFYINGQLLLENFTSQINLSNGHSVVERLEMGFDHSYWFIQSFIKVHLDFHARYLGILKS